MAHCFWDNYEGHKKLHLANWHLICMNKEHRGLGSLALKILTYASWGHRLRGISLMKTKSRGRWCIISTIKKEYPVV
jgi:hypothetical protein